MGGVVGNHRHSHPLASEIINGQPVIHAVSDNNGARHMEERIADPHEFPPAGSCDNGPEQIDLVVPELCQNLIPVFCPDDGEFHPQLCFQHLDVVGCNATVVSLVEKFYRPEFRVGRQADNRVLLQP